MRENLTYQSNDSSSVHPFKRCAIHYEDKKHYVHSFIWLCRCAKNAETFGWAYFVSSQLQVKYISVKFNQMSLDISIKDLIEECGILGGVDNLGFCLRHSIPLYEEVHSWLFIHATYASQSPSISLYSVTLSMLHFSYKKIQKCVHLILYLLL